MLDRTNPRNKNFKSHLKEVPLIFYRESFLLKQFSFPNSKKHHQNYVCKNPTTVLFFCLMARNYIYSIE